MNLRNSIFFTLPKLFRQAFGQYKRYIAVLTLLGFVSGLLEGIGISTIIPLFAFITKSDFGRSNFISQTIRALFGFLGVPFTLKNLLIFVSLLFILKIITLFLITYSNARILNNYQEQNQSRLFNRTLKAQWSFLYKQKIGNLDQILKTNVANVTGLLACVGTLILVGAQLLIYTAVALSVSWQVTILTVVLGVLTFVFFRPLFRYNKKQSALAEVLNRTSSHYANENMIGVKTVKTMVAETAVMRRAAKYFAEANHLGVTITAVKGTVEALIQILGVVFILAVFVYFYKLTDFDFGSFAVIVYAINQILLQVQAAQVQMHRISQMIPYLDSMLEYAEEAGAQAEQDSGQAEFSFQTQIEFKDVAFFYNADQKVLEGINLSVKRGELIGLIGSSGAGKTTLVDLLLRLLKPTQGKILLDGRNIQDIKILSWRKNIGYITQDMFLMNDSICNNIRFYDDSVSDDIVKQVARLANIYDFIAGCPQGFDTIVGERGIMLSVGQRQRIIIARILARAPQFLILDEATSALDNEAEVEIQKVINGLKGKVTVLVIAHRLSTIANADRLLVLDKGKIVEEGSPQKLLQDENSYFNRVYNLGT